jgi:hypothetical protein
MLGVGISFREVALLMNTTPETVSRWRQGRIGATPADRIERDRVEDVLALIKQLQNGAFV